MHDAPILHCRARLHNEISLCVQVQLWRWAGEDEPGVADGHKEWCRWVSQLAQILRHPLRRPFVRQTKVELCEADAVAGSPRTSLARRHPPANRCWSGESSGGALATSGVEQWKKPFAKKKPRKEERIGISPECLAWKGWLIFPDRRAPVESVGG
jgi:hypothetical protein